MFSFIHITAASTYHYCYRGTCHNLILWWISLCFGAWFCFSVMLDKMHWLAGWQSAPAVQTWSPRYLLPDDFVSQTWYMAQAIITSRVVLGFLCFLTPAITCALTVVYSISVLGFFCQWRPTLILTLIEDVVTTLMCHKTQLHLVSHFLNLFRLIHYIDKWPCAINKTFPRHRNRSMTIISQASHRSLLSTVACKSIHPPWTFPHVVTLQPQM